jgi:hypothetical protein
LSIVGDHKTKELDLWKLDNFIIDDFIDVNCLLNSLVPRKESHIID